MYSLIILVFVHKHAVESTLLQVGWWVKHNILNSEANIKSTAGLDQRPNMDLKLDREVDLPLNVDPCRECLVPVGEKKMTDD